MLGAGLSVGALALRGLPGASGPAPVDHYMTSGTMPAWASVQRSTSGSRVRSDTRLIEILGPNTARLTASPVTGVCLGLLLEPDALYYGPQSEDQSATGWALFNGLMVTAITSNSPLRTGDTISRISNGVQSFSALSSSSVVQPSAGSTVCWLVKRGTTTTGCLVLRNTTQNQQINANLVWSGDALTSITLPANAFGLSCPSGGVIDYGDGWYLAWIDCIYPETDNIRSLRIDPDQSAAGKSLDIASAWVVSGTHGYPPSYLPTTTAAVQRYADNLTIDWMQLASAPLIIEYMTLAGVAATPLVIAPNTQPTGLAGIVTRMHQ